MVPVTVNLLKGNRVVRLTPDALLQAGHSYYVGVRSGLKDAAGIASTYDSDYSWFFTASQAEDGIAPQLTALSPGEGANNVGINSRVHIRFDESINPISFLGDDVDLPLAQALINYDARYYSLSFSDLNREVVYVPHEPWPVSSDVTFTVTTPEDYAGHLVQSTSHTFHTINGPDTTEPVAEEWSIASDATNVPVNAVLKVSLNEAIDPITVTANTFYLYDVVARQFVTPNRSVGSDGRNLTLVPDQVLAVGHKYNFFVYGVQDLSGNVISDSRYFTTSMAADTVAPQITGYSIEAGQVSVPTNVQLQVRFDETVGSLSLGKVELRKGAEAIMVTRELSYDHKTLTLRLAQPLLTNTGYTLHVEGIEDLSGNVLGGTVDRDFITGTAADVASPSVAQYSPANNAVNVSLNTPIVVSFAERLNPLSVNRDSIALVDSVTHQRIATTMDISADGKTVTLTPAVPLLANRQYDICILCFGYLYDLAGNQIKSTYWYFRTGAV
jgi:hypothetical protein